MPSFLSYFCFHRPSSESLAPAGTSYGLESALKTLPVNQWGLEGQEKIETYAITGAFTQFSTFALEDLLLSKDLEDLVHACRSILGVLRPSSEKRLLRRGSHRTCL